MTKYELIEFLLDEGLVKHREIKGDAEPNSHHERFDRSPDGRRICPACGCGRLWCDHETDLVLKAVDEWFEVSG